MRSSPRAVGLQKDLLVPLTDQTRRRDALYVAVEPGLSALLPVLRVIGIDAGAITQPAEEGALRRIDHDADMPRPNHQVPGLRMRHSLEVVTSGIEVGRTCVGIRKTGLEIDGVNQV